MDTPALSLPTILQCSSFLRHSLQVKLGSLDTQELTCWESQQKDYQPSLAYFEEATAGIQNRERLASRLRNLRRELLEYLIYANCTGIIDYHGVVRAMTLFARVAINVTSRVCCHRLALRCGVPTNSQGKPMDWLIYGMGKLGGGELNVSSDIDLIFVYPEDGDTRAIGRYVNARKEISNQEFFTRLARMVIPTLHDVTNQGFVFRVDMRLRPNGDSGPIVCSGDMLETYLYTQGRDWERFAWLKANVMNQAFFMSESDFAQEVKILRNTIRPFVYRKYLDFGAIDSIVQMHEMMRAETMRRESQRTRLGRNVKLGRGGIREIEFLTQTFQIIRGGRDLDLRGCSTLPMLEVLAHKKILSPETAHFLQQAYVFYRNVEHAIQYIDDKQTHLLPFEGRGLECIATLLQMTPDALWERMNETSDKVATIFRQELGIHKKEERSVKRQRWPMGWHTGTSTALQRLEAYMLTLGYTATDITNGMERLVALAQGRLSPMASRKSLRILRTLLEKIVRSCPDWARREARSSVSATELLTRYLRLMEAIAGRTTYFTMLSQYPQALDRIAHVLCASRWSTDFIATHPVILDEVLTGASVVPDRMITVHWKKWRRRVDQLLASYDGDVERQMNLLRDEYHSALFRILLADVEEKLTVESVSLHLSSLADQVLAIVIHYAWLTIAKRHCRHPRFAIVGYGKLGGKELGYESDLDLVFLFDDEDPSAYENYSRLVRRILTWLTVFTSSGRLFQVDMRLRPNGENGLAVCTYQHFEKYQNQINGTGAWIWEHQALTRARFVAGDLEIGMKIEDLRRRVLMMDRSAMPLRERILSMRQRMHERHKSRVGQMNIKHDAGGMIDVEFIVQFMVLRWSHQYPILVENLGNIALLETMIQLGLLPEELTQKVIHSYRRYRALQHAWRLNAGDDTQVWVSVDSVQKEKEAVMSLYQKVLLDA